MIEPAPLEGIVISVRVIPRARKSGVAGARGNALVVRVQAPAVEDAANLELIRVLAEVFEVPKRAVSIVAGAHSRQKRIHVAGLTAATAVVRLANAGSSMK